MACFIDEEITIENVKKNLVAVGVNEKDAAHDAAILVDFFKKSREKNGDCDPPGYAIIPATKKEKAEAFNMAQNSAAKNVTLTEENWTELAAELAAVLTDRAAARREREAAVILDPSKDFTGKFDSYCNPIYNGSILAIHSGWEGYWTVFKNDAGEWLTRSIVEPGEEPEIWPLSQNLGHSEVIENAEKHLAALLAETASGGLCGECEYRPLCDQENFARCRACDGKE